MAEKLSALVFEEIVPAPAKLPHAAVLHPDLAARYYPFARFDQTERRSGDNRRSSFWRSLLYGNFRPRRRSSRREADAHHFYFDWHEPRILFLALGILLLSCIDALFTLNLLHAGATEANVFMARLLEHSIDKFLAVKIFMTAASVVILVAAARRKFIGIFNVEHVLQVCCIGYFAVICYELYLYWYVFDLKVLPVL